MLYLDFTNTLSIRPLRNEPQEIAAVAQMQCRAYTKQFYDRTGPLQGELGIRFPVLRKYENSDYFQATWDKLAYLTTKAQPEGYAYVAFMRGKNGSQQPVGIIKNTQWEAGSDLCDQLTSFAFVQRMQDVAELGSLYVDPSWQYTGIGTKLVSRFAREARNRGFIQLVTRAYERNTSPAFFSCRTGARQLGKCQIPISYNPDLLEKAGLKISQMPQSIPGVWLFWSDEASRKIAKLRSSAILSSKRRYSSIECTPEGYIL